METENATATHPPDTANPAASAPASGVPPVAASPAAAPAEKPEPPPVAKLVVTGTKTEREILLERENKELLDAKLERERQIAETEKKFQDYRQAVETKPAPKQKKVGVGWFESEE